MKYLVILFFGLALTAHSSLAAEGATVGKITQLEGRVDITRDGEAAFSAEINTPIFMGDIIRTKSRSKAEILFEDGSILRLASSTRIKITEYVIKQDQLSSVINLYRGKIQSKVTKTLGRLFGLKKRNRFEVHTPTAIVGVRGTDFFTFHQRGITGSIFKEGIGYCYSLHRPDDIREISAGQTMLVTGPDQPPVLRPATDQEIEQHEGDTAPPEKEEDKSDTDDDSDTVENESEGNQDNDEGVTENENGEEASESSPAEAVEEEPNDMGPGDEGPKDTAQGEEGPDEQTPAEDLPGEPDTQPAETDPPGPEPNEPDAIMTEETEAETFIDGQNAPEPLHLDPAGEDPLMAAPQPDDQNAFDTEIGEPGVMEPVLSDSFSTEPYPMDPHIMESFLMEPFPAEMDTMEPLLADPYPMDAITTDTAILYIPPEIPDETPPPMEVLFDGIVFRLISGTASQGTYFNPNETSWPYDSTSDHMGPFDGERYEYFYISDTNGNYLYGRDESWGNGAGDEIEHEYLQDGRIITFCENEEDYFSEILVTGTWEGDLSFLDESPSSDHRLLFAESAPFDVLGPNGWLRGGFSSDLNGLWTNTVTPFLMKGEYNTGTSPSIFGMQIRQATDDGAYAGFIGGFIGEMTGDDIEGLTYSIYIDSNNEAGILNGHLAGSKISTDGTWEAAGEFTRTTITSDLSGIDASLLEDNLDLGMMGSDRVFGTFTGDGWIKSKGGHGTTISIHGQDWGVFNLFQGGGNIFENPTGSTSWTAGFVGWGKFGSFQDDASAWKSDFGIWQSGFGNGQWSNGRLSGTFGTGSRFLTLTKIGNLDGEILGTYDGNGSSGTWQAVSMGSWSKTQDLSFSTYLGSENHLLKAVTSGNYYYSDGSDYSYRYDMDGRDGNSYYHNTADDTETRKEYNRRGLDDNLYASVWVHDDTTHTLQSYSSSGPLTDFDMTSLGVAPNPDYSDHYEWDDYRMREDSCFEGILGGLSDPWTATAASPSEIVLLGERELSNNGAVNQPTIFSDSMQSYNPYNDTFTTPDGGSFQGYFGGRFQGDVKGRIYNLYIAPDGTGGILKGGFSGIPNAGGGAWSAEGGIYPIQMDAGIAVSPQDLCGNVIESEFYLNGYYDNGFQAPGSGSFYDPSGAITGDILLYNGDARLASIQNQSWGVWQNCIGGIYSGTPEGTWSLDFKADKYTDGSLEAQLLASYDITGLWNSVNNRIDGTVLGGWADLDELSPMTGVSAGEIVGTFNPTDSTWQAALVGAWIETDQFLTLAATSAGRARLEALHIPAIEIGRANLYGSSSSMSVMMNDVVFFSNASGGDPKIWATNDVDGYYSATPYIDEAVTLTGNGLSVDFQIKKWDSGHWGAAVNGGGAYSGTGTMDGETIGMDGAAAGTYDGAGTFSGTAAGVAKKQ
ncbi:MAG: FecR domain-containing protein [Deltaproteobacteria bacterium]|nr:FecR domain-containing protein [Deltaproteobacteria bacterium]